MAEIENVLQTNSQSITNYSTDKLFIGNNRFLSGSLKNTGSASITLPVGTLLAKVIDNALNTANVIGYLCVYNSSNTEGGAIPVGILSKEITIAAGEVATGVSYCNQGEFDLDGLIFNNGTDTLDTIVNGKAIREAIIAETQLIGVSVDQMSGYDNQ
ncbi:MAG: hypothetical protein H6Q17_553 [Bacteroidetes bacterium]|nr:hypothetical protein [Bacteroidota bacterium]